MRSGVGIRTVQRDYPAYGLGMSPGVPQEALESVVVRRMDVLYAHISFLLSERHREDRGPHRKSPSLRLKTRVTGRRCLTESYSSW